MYTYELIIKNDIKTSDLKFEYYDPNKVVIFINSKGIVIKSYYKNKTESYSKFIDRYKIACMIYLLKYGKLLNMEITSFKEINKEINTDNLFNNIKNNYCFKDYYFEKDNCFFSKKVINSYLKMKFDSPLQISLNAYMISNTKDYGFEKFLYLWIMFNGMYNIFYETKENEKISSYLKKIHNLDYLIISSKNRNKIIPRVINSLNTDTNLNTESLINLFIKYLKECKVKINYNLLENTDKFKYIFLTEFGYYFRCNLFHGNKKIDLFDINNKEKYIIKLLCILLKQEFEENIELLIDSIDEKYYKKKKN